MAEGRYTIEENADGSAIVKLQKPVMLDGQPLDRLTVPALRGKHMRHASWAYGSVPTMGQVIGFAAEVVLPRGALDELEAHVARDLAVEVTLLLGKSQATGEAPSPT